MEEAFARTLGQANCRNMSVKLMSVVFFLKLKSSCWHVLEGASFLFQLKLNVMHVYRENQLFDCFILIHIQSELLL